MIEDRNYQEIAFEEIRKALKFDVKPNISIIETCLLSQPIKLSDLTVNHLEFFYGNKITTLSFAYDKNVLCYEIVYRANYIPSYFIGYFENLINEILASTDKKVSEYELMSIDQKKNYSAIGIIRINPIQKMRLFTNYLKSKLKEILTISPLFLRANNLTMRS
ncbi:hypothetical protein [Cysteiniphilum sp. 6C5]|uniref:hypothetical protein n=1 Tax=unclassified Cysteiniphilum TaxID=2610889 RepID=UPI003F849463